MEESLKERESELRMNEAESIAVATEILAKRNSVTLSTEGFTYGMVQALGSHFDLKVYIDFPDKKYVLTRNELTEDETTMRIR